MFRDALSEGSRRRDAMHRTTRQIGSGILCWLGDVGRAGYDTVGTDCGRECLRSACLFCLVWWRPQTRMPPRTSATDTLAAFSGWHTLPADLLHIVLRQHKHASILCATALTCSAWHAVVMSEPALIEEAAHARFPHLQALLMALRVPHATLDFRALYADQAQALQLPARPKSKRTLDDYVFTFTIKADGVTSMQWTGHVNSDYSGIVLSSTGSAPCWAYDEPDEDPDYYEFAVWQDFLPRLTLDALVSCITLTGVRSMLLCKNENWSNSDEDSILFRVQLPHQNELSLAPWVDYRKCNWGTIYPGCLFIDRGDPVEPDQLLEYLDQHFR